MIYNESVLKRLTFFIGRENIMKNKFLKILTISMASVLVLAGCSGGSTESGESESPYKSVSTEELSAKSADENWVVVDTRDSNAFNGWEMDGVKKGGHIEGAVDFSAKWLQVENKDKEQILDEALENKGILSDKNIILYDENGSDANAVAKYLSSKGYKNIYTYDLNDWENGQDKAMVKYPGYEIIVPPSVVKALIDGDVPDTFEKDKTIKMVEASWGEEKESYEKGHIPGSIHINTDSIEPPPAWMLADDATLLNVILENGISKNDTVIVSSESQMAAYRVALVLRYAGIEDVRVLNGGTSAWTAAGYELETTSNKPLAISDFGGDFPGNPDIIDTIQELQQMLPSKDFTLVDNRTWDEYIGKTSGYSYHDKTGRIPGAVFGYAGKSDSNSLDYYRNIDNTMRNADEITAMLANQGINPNNHLSFMCGSGWRAAEVLYYANVAGFDNVSLYSDGWIGWSNAGLPSETGEPVK